MGINKKTLEGWEQNRNDPALRHLPAVIGFLGYDPRNRSRNGVIDDAIDAGPARIVGEPLLPQSRGQRRDVAGGMILDTLQHIDQVGVRIDLL